ncbi:MAG TPA: hypothetical protein VNJ08_09670 [Bacteriovoracaceae bacterium]|nr:hypothetical protein [Bacteriovoracaceae bacterium]
MKFLMTFFTALLFSLSVFAEEAKLCVITADIDPVKGTLFVEVVDGKADSLRIISTENQKITGDDSYPVETLTGREGLVAIQRSGHDVVVLRLANFSADKGGVVIIDYLYNGITKKRRQLKLNFVKEGTAFVLRTEEGQAINQLHFKGHRIFRQVVGLKSIEASFR